MAAPNSQAARKAASLLAGRYDLTPRVDIETFVQKFATVEPCTWPNSNVDGLTVHATQSDGQPQIFYRSSQSPRRIRFTLAHELGHVILGWHIGTAQCTVDVSGAERSPDEREADAFAANLLIPDNWISSLLTAGLGMSEVIERLADADVSPYASVIALSNGLPPGWAFELASAPQLTSGFMKAYSRAELRSASARGSATLHNRTVKWWRLFGSKDFVADTATFTAEESLRDALDATGSALGAAQLTGKVGGYLGSTKVAMLQHPADMFAYVLWRLESEGSALPAHDGFKYWLSCRVVGIARKRTRP